MASFRPAGCPGFACEPRLGPSRRGSLANPGYPAGSKAPSNRDHPGTDQGRPVFERKPTRPGVAQGNARPRRGRRADWHLMVPRVGAVTWLRPSGLNQGPESPTGLGSTDLGPTVEVPPRICDHPGTHQEPFSSISLSTSASERVPFYVDCAETGELTGSFATHMSFAMVQHAGCVSGTVTVGSCGTPIGPWWGDRLATPPEVE